MSLLDLKRKEVELLQVSAAKAQIELRIHERLEEIDRLKEHVKVSEQTEAKLKDEISKLRK